MAAKPASPDTHAGLTEQPTRMCKVKPLPLNGAGQNLVIPRIIGLKKARPLVHAPILILRDVVNCLYKPLSGLYNI